MSDKNPLRELVRGLDPAQQFPLIGVTRQTVNAEESAVHRNVAPVHPQRAGSLQEALPARSRGLISDQAEQRVRIRHSMLDVVENAASREHPAPGDDDTRTFQHIELLRFRDGAVEVHVPWKQLALPSPIEAVPHAMLGGELRVDLGRVHRHGAVDVDRHFREPSRLHELAEHERDLLSAPDREGGNQHHAAALEGGAEGLGDLIGERRLLVHPIAIGRFHDQDVAVGKIMRIAMQRHVIPTHVAAEHDLERRSPRFMHLHLDHRRAQNVSSVPEPSAQLR